jgi:hypothetical protein
MLGETKIKHQNFSGYGTEWARHNELLTSNNLEIQKGTSD